MQPNPYLFFAGDCFDAMSLYAETLGGDIACVVRNSDVENPDDRMPGPEGMVMNMAITLGDMMIIGSDNTSSMYQTPQGFRLQLEAASAEEYDRLHDVLGKDARAVDMPTCETFWAERFAMFTDRFGTPWMLNFTGAKEA